MELKIKVICEHLPGTDFPGLTGAGAKPVHLGIQRGNEVIEAVPANRKRVIFEPNFSRRSTAEREDELSRPLCQRNAGRTILLSMLGSKGQRRPSEGFRRAKIHLSHLPWSQVEEAIQSKSINRYVVAYGQEGRPRCASIRSNEARGRKRIYDQTAEQDAI